MIAHLIKGASPDELEAALNKFFADCFFESDPTPDVSIRGGEIAADWKVRKQLKIISVQQYTVGTVDRSAIQTSQQPNVNYSFQLLIIYRYE
jgi:hypothetical protein